MDQLIQHIELFEAYQAKKLDESEILEFEARLNSDSDFRKAFQDFLSIEEGLKDHYKREFKAQFIELDKQLDIDLYKRSNSPLKKIILFSSAIAASICMLFIGYSYYQTQKNIEIAKEYWPVEPGLPVKMSSKGKYDEAMNAYKLGEWDKAIKEFSKIESDTSTYFLGEISYRKGNYKNAIHFFETIPKGSSYSDLAMLKKALCYVVFNKNKAILTLTTLVKLQSNQYSVLAKRVLKKL